MTKFCNKFFLISCKKYSEYFSRNLDGDTLTSRERRSMGLHYFFCTFCRRFAKQLKLIDKVSNDCFEDEKSSCCDKLSESRKEKIREVLKDS